jgi:hypothetical protein
LQRSAALHSQSRYRTSVNFSASSVEHFAASSVQNSSIAVVLFTRQHSSLWFAANLLVNVLLLKKQFSGSACLTVKIAHCSSTIELVDLIGTVGLLA